MLTLDEALAEAVANHRAGRLEAAAALYRRVLEADPDNADAGHLLGLTEWHAGRKADALALIARALHLNPGLTDARLNLATLLRADGNGAGAEAQWRAVIAHDPANAAAWFSLSGLTADQGAAGRARSITALRRAVRCAPSLAEAHHNLGVLLRQDEQVAEAAASHRRALAAQPDFVPAWMNLGNALLELGDNDGAVSSLRTALCLAPGSRECWFNLGNVHYARADIPAALTCYQRAAELGLGVARARIVACLVDLGRLAEAEGALVRYLPLDGTDVPSCVELLFTLMMRTGRQDQAVPLFTRLAEVPFAGVLYTTEFKTALAALDLAAGRAAQAADRLDGLRSDNCWMFTTRSLAALRRTLDDRQVTLDRPVNPEPTRPRLTSSTLGNRGRFAHNALEYILLRLYAEKHGYVLETPDWVGGMFFDLDDPRPGAPLPPWPFGRHILNDLVTGQGDHAPVADRDVLSPLFLFEYRQEYRDKVRAWLTPRAHWAPFLDPAVQALRAGGRTVIALHIRRGDFIQYKYPVTETRWYVEWLRELWPAQDRPVLYLASDDLEAIRPAFAEFQPVTLADVAPPWPGLEFLQDFHVLTQADIVGISAASGFSQLAARLNTRARLCVEPDVEAGRIRPFTPWTP
ncbi:tetratricopeptide repeat protein [Novispirillum sp. DQ9]|uniref:tetratricopeptide repeat protein n=1 Tax=Novispirillum sp. DQ9 TaxID=3398612 RepID=UPI003C7E3E1E